MVDRRTLLHQTADLAADFLEGLDRRPVRAQATHDELVGAFGGPLPERGEAPGEVVDHLATIADPGLIASAGPRYFGFGWIGSTASPSIVSSSWIPIVSDMPPPVLLRTTTPTFFSGTNTTKLWYPPVWPLCQRAPVRLPMCHPSPMSSRAS